jgi:hypothetical protein
MALIIPNFRQLGFFPENRMSNCEPSANQGKESTAAASVVAKMVSTMSKRTDFRRASARHLGGPFDFAQDMLCAFAPVTVFPNSLIHNSEKGDILNFRPNVLVQGDPEYARLARP